MLGYEIESQIKVESQVWGQGRSLESIFLLIEVVFESRVMNRGRKFGPKSGPIFRMVRFKKSFFKKNSLQCGKVIFHKLEENNFIWKIIF